MNSDGPKGVRERYRAYLERLSRRFSRRARAFSPRIACRTGCFRCCVGLFEITPLDAAVAAEGLARLPGPEREAVRRRGKAILERLAPRFPGNRRTFVLDAAREEEQEAFFDRAAAIPCPFLRSLPETRAGAGTLARDHAWPRGYVCAIYAHRPQTCRTFGLPLSDGGAIVAPACRRNFRGERRNARLLRAASLPAFDPEDLALSRAARSRLGWSAEEATILPAVAAGASPWRR